MRLSTLTAVVATTALLFCAAPADAQSRFAVRPAVATQSQTAAGQAPRVGVLGRLRTGAQRVLRSARGMALRAAFGRRGAEVIDHALSQMPTRAEFRAAAAAALAEQQAMMDGAGDLGMADADAQELQAERAPRATRRSASRERRVAGTSRNTMERDARGRFVASRGRASASRGRGTSTRTARANTTRSRATESADEAPARATRNARAATSRRAPARTARAARAAARRTVARATVDAPEGESFLEEVEGDVAHAAGPLLDTVLNAASAVSRPAAAVAGVVRGVAGAAGGASARQAAGSHAPSGVHFHFVRSRPDGTKTNVDFELHTPGTLLAGLAGLLAAGTGMPQLLQMIMGIFH